MNKKLLFSQKIPILLFIFVGIGIFFSGIYFSGFKNVSRIQQFVKQIPETTPDYLGEIVSKEGNLLIIKYFEKKDTPIDNLTTKETRLSFLKKASLEEKIKIGETLKQKVEGTVTILVPLNTPIYLKKEVPIPTTLLKLKRGDFVVIWGDINGKGQVVSNFIVSANPKNYEQR